MQPQVDDEARPTHDDSQSQRAADQIPEQTPVMEPFEIEDSGNAEEAEYPKGLKFASILMAIGLSLVLIGLVSVLQGHSICKIEAHPSTVGLQYYSHCCPSHHNPLQNDCRCWLVLFGVVSLRYPLHQPVDMPKKRL